MEILPAKAAGDTIQVVFNFGGLMPVGEVITATSLVVEGQQSISGPLDVSAPPDVTETEYRQDVSGGDEGDVYQIICTVHTSGGQDIIKTAHLAVLSNDPAVRWFNDK